MTQLTDAVWAQIQQRCATEGWLGGPNGDVRLAPDGTTLYDVNKYIILPSTVKRKCSFVEMIASGAQVPKYFVSHWWGEPVKAFIACLEQHVIDQV